MNTLNEVIPLGDGRSTSEDTDTHSSDSFLPEHTGNQVNERWQRIQAEFVDDPRASVSGANQLVSELVQRITDTFSKERNDLEHQWSKGESVSTEDLRVCLQRYRNFFTRLLPLGEKPLEDR